jgi:hypothetical protein
MFPMVSISAVVYGAARTYTSYKDQQAATGPSKFGMTAVGLSLFRNFVMLHPDDTSAAFKALSPDKKIVTWTLALVYATLLQSANVYLCCRMGDEIGHAITHKNRELR